MSEWRLHYGGALITVSTVFFEQP